jgi:hypothetical protein
MSDMKLKSLIEGFVNKKDEWSIEEKKAALGMIGKYNEYGRILRREHNLMEIAQTLQEIAKSAERFTLNETDEWFDKNTVSRNMKELSRCSGEFGKLARESYVVEQRMEALYEDMGHVLNRYFSINDEGSIVPKVGAEEKIDGSNEVPEAK